MAAGLFIQSKCKFMGGQYVHLLAELRNSSGEKGQTSVSDDDRRRVEEIPPCKCVNRRLWSSCTRCGADRGMGEGGRQRDRAETGLNRTICPLRSSSQHKSIPVEHHWIKMQPWIHSHGKPWCPAQLQLQINSRRKQWYQWKQEKHSPCSVYGKWRIDLV